MPRAAREPFTAPAGSTGSTPGTLAPEQAEPGGAGVQVSGVHLQDDGQQEHRLAFEVDLRSAVEGLPELAGGALTGRQPEDPLRGWPVLVQESQQVLQGTEEESCLAGDRPWDRGTFPLCWGHRLCGGASGMGPPWPGLLTWMVWGSAPSWLQRAARGRPKRAPLPPEPNCPGASAAAEVPRRTKGQGSPLLLLRVPPAAKAKRAKSRGGEAPGRTCPAGRAAAAPVQHQRPSARGGEKGHPACLLQTHQPSGRVHLGCQRGWVVAAALHQPARNTLCSPNSPEQKGPLASCIGPWPWVRGGDGRDCTGSDPHLCLALDQPLQAAGVECRRLGKGKRARRSEAMQLMLSWSSTWGQSGDRRDTHSIAGAQLLQQELDGGQLGDLGSLRSFWWPVRGEGAEKEQA